jgi:hypothetical protein
MVPPRLIAVPAAGKPGADAEMYNLGRGPENGAQRLRRLQQETRLLAREQVEALARDVERLAERAGEIAVGGEAFPVGVRELASRIASDLPDKAKGLLAIMDRNARV